MGDASREILRRARQQVPEWTPSQVHENFTRQQGNGPGDQDFVLVDVREPLEAEIAHIEGARNIPLRELPGRLAELPGHSEIVTLCHHGPRSLKAREILKGAGFASVRSLSGGIDAWSREVDDSVPRY